MEEEIPRDGNDPVRKDLSPDEVIRLFEEIRQQQLAALSIFRILLFVVFVMLFVSSLIAITILVTNVIIYLKLTSSNWKCPVCDVKIKPQGPKTPPHKCSHCGAGFFEKGDGENITD